MPGLGTRFPPFPRLQRRRGLEGLDVEIAGLGSVAKLLEAFGHKRGQLPQLVS